MKLGDNMTMEAYKVWRDVAPRKCRPPRIGDIPKHGAIDEESPGSSAKALTISPSDSRDSTLTVPSDSPRNIVLPLGPDPTIEESTPLRKFEERKNPGTVVTSSKDEYRYPIGKETQPRNIGGAIQDCRSSRRELERTPVEAIPAKQEESSVRRSSSPRKSNDRVGRRSTDRRSDIRIEFPSAEESTVVPTESPDSPRIPSSPEDNLHREIVEVRKDSALFLEEAEGLPTLREILISRAPRIIRPRRESSGYSSNLGTFDEDRRNSSSTDVLQDLSSFLKERRRSSTKRLNLRINVGRAEEHLAEEIANSAVDRMPTTEVYRKVSSAGLEMANIEEVKEVLRDEATSGQDSLDGLCNLVKRVSVEELSARCRQPSDASVRDAPSRDSVLSDLEIIDTSRTCPTVELRDPSRDVFDTRNLRESIGRVSTPLIGLPSSSRNLSNRMVHQISVPSSSSKETWNVARNIAESPRWSTDVPETRVKVERPTISTGISTSYNEEHDGRGASPRRKVEENISLTRSNAETDKMLPRSIKVYQLLSTQSEDRADGEARLTDRRTSLQISKQDDAALPIGRTVESNDVSALYATRYNSDGSGGSKIQGQLSMEIAKSAVRKLSSPGEVESTQKFLGDAPSVGARPIYPYCPYSPYGSPQGSPRNRRRPLRESRRVSIDNRQGALQLKQYKLLDNIGQGSYGIVKLVYNEEDETHYAMKILSKRKLMKKAGIFGRMAPGKKGAANPLAKVYREIALLKKLDHPNVVKLVEVLDDPDEDKLYLVFELVQRGEVLEIPTDKPLDEETARNHFRDVVMGVEYLHYQRIVHRDIKPSNLLVDSDGHIKIADLGVSAELRASGELLSGPAGTPAFAAPETTTPGAHYSGTLCDVWSMGVTLYSLVTGRLPWDGAGSIIGVQAAVRTDPLKFPDRPALSDDLRDLILRMLTKDPEERITLSDIKEHTWLTNRGAEPLPSETDNCRLPVTVTDEEVERVVTRVPKLDTLILIKKMLKQHSFQHPFLSKKSNKAMGSDTVVGSLEISGPERPGELLPPRQAIRNLKSERFQRAGRSNSAPDSYDWQTNGSQISVESSLPPVTEASYQESEVERR